MFFKKTALLLASLCFSLFLSTQANAGGVFYSNEGDTVMIPNDTEVVILLKKGTEITAIDSHGKTMPSCLSCAEEANPIKMAPQQNLWVN